MQLTGNGALRALLRQLVTIEVLNLPEIRRDYALQASLYIFFIPKLQLTKTHFQDRKRFFVQKVHYGITWLKLNQSFFSLFFPLFLHYFSISTLSKPYYLIHIKVAAIFLNKVIVLVEYIFHTLKDQTGEKDFFAESRLFMRHLKIQC